MSILTPRISYLNNPSQPTDKPNEWVLRMINKKPMVVNLRDNPTGDYIRVDRGTMWGNPFWMKNSSEKERKRVCKLFEKFAVKELKAYPHWLKLLRGKNLACWCAPKQCHAETLMRLANEP